MKDYDKYKESLYFKYWDANNLYGWTMSEKLPVNKLDWNEDVSQFTEDFTKSYNNQSDEGYFLEVDIQYPENIHEHHNDLPFLEKINETLKSRKDCY